MKGHTFCPRTGVLCTQGRNMLRPLMFPLCFPPANLPTPIFLSLSRRQWIRGGRGRGRTAEESKRHPNGLYLESNLRFPRRADMFPCRRIRHVGSCKAAKRAYVFNHGCFRGELALASARATAAGTIGAKANSALILRSQCKMQLQQEAIRLYPNASNRSQSPGPCHRKSAPGLLESSQ